MSAERHIIRKPTRSGVKEKIFALVFLVPYLEPFLGGTASISSAAVYRSVLSAELALAVLFFISTVLMRKSLNVRINHWLLIFIIYLMLLQTFSGGYRDHNISMAIWILMPVICASVTVRFIEACSMDLRIIAEYAIHYFVLLCVLLLVYNIAYLSFGVSSRRIHAPAGDSVVFGYTVAVFFSLLIVYKKRFSGRVYVLYKIVLTAIALLTGSRGGVWPILILWMIDYLITDITVGKAAFSVVLISAFVLFDPIDLLSRVFPRLFVVSDASRGITSQSLAQLLTSGETISPFFGTGLGNLFPYQAWVSNNVIGLTVSMNSNLFSFGGYTMLVQPHNTALYLLAETGLIGLLLYVASIFGVLSNTNHQRRVKYGFIVVATIIFVNMFDSIMVVEPGVAYIFCLILFLTKDNDCSGLASEKRASTAFRQDRDR